MQREIVEPCELLDDHGLLVRPGYARRPLWRYDRARIRAPWYRIKEWDYYAVLSQGRGYGISLTIADLGYLGLASVCWLDFVARRFYSCESWALAPRGRLGLPSRSDAGETRFRDRRLEMTFAVGPGNRSLRVDCPGFKGPAGGRGLRAELCCAERENADRMVIASSWRENPRAFYYNQKVNCLPVTGTVVLGGQELHFSPEDSFAVLDWGRGHWPYRTHWYWGSASGLWNGIPVGWNLGYGFGDRSAATENMLFFDGRGSKLEEVTFHLDPRDYLKPWKITSSDGRFEMTFRPILDRQATVHLGLLKSVQHQVFGTYEGEARLDDGTALVVEGMLGFAEDVVNWW
jgi:hypothetical protein